MRLQRLTGMERQKILDEYAELEAKIAELRAILGSDQKLMDLIRSELRIIREKYADERRTRFVEASGELSIEDLIAPEDQVITLSVNGYIKRSSPSEYAAQRRGGKGRKGARPRAEDSVKEDLPGQYALETIDLHSPGSNIPRAGLSSAQSWTGCSRTPCGESGSTFTR